MKCDRDPGDNPSPAPICGRADQQTGDVTNCGADDEQKTEMPIPLCIKIIAGNDKHGFLSRETSVQDDHGRRDDQKKQQEAESREQHASQPGAHCEKLGSTADNSVPRFWPIRIVACIGVSNGQQGFDRGHADRGSNRGVSSELRDFRFAWTSMTRESVADA
jgi:hypothetical protein